MATNNYINNLDDITALVAACSKYINNPADESKLADRGDKLMSKYNQAHREQNKTKIKRTNDELYRFVRDIIKFLEDHQTHAKNSYVIPDKDKYPEIKQANQITSNLIKEYALINSLEKLVQ